MVSKRDEPLDPYKRVRKPVAPPERVIPNRRRKRQDQRVRREIEEERRRK